MFATQLTMMVCTAYLWEGLELVEVFDGAEQLQTDRGRDDEQTHREQNQTAQLLAWSKDLHCKKLLSKLKHHKNIIHVYTSNIMLFIIPSSKSLQALAKP